MIPWLQEIVLALRWLGRRPGLAVTAVVSLGLGIGANAAVFSLIDALLLRPIPISHPEELVKLESVRRERHETSRLRTTVISRRVRAF